MSHNPKTHSSLIADMRRLIAAGTDPQTLSPELRALLAVLKKDDPG